MLAHGLKSEPRAMAMLIDRCDQERDASVREMLLSLLQGNATAQVRSLGARLVSSADSARRLEGFMLMGSLPPTDASRQLALQALEQEQEPKVLASALRNLVYPEASDPAQSGAVMQSVRQLTQHEDASVRSTSLVALAQLDKSGAVAEPYVAQGLVDRESEVRLAALDVVVQRNLRSEKLKGALFQVLSNSNEDVGVRGRALYALNNFTLNSADYELYQRQRSEIQRLSKEQMSKLSQ